MKKPLLASAVVAGLIWMIGIYPGWFDAPEFAVAIDSLGVSHPSGHPTYLLIGYIFHWLPIGSIAFRTSLFSSVAAAGAVVLCWRILETVKGEGTFAGVLLALILLAHPSIALQIARTEVYSPQFFLSLLIVALLLLAHEKDDARFSLAAAFTFGLSFALQPLLSVVLAPLFLYSSLFLKPRKTSLLSLCLFSSLGLLIYLYLPLRATRSPFLNWDAPQTWGQFWLAFTARDFQELFHQPWSREAVRDWAHADILQIAPVWFLATAAAGLFILCRQWGARVPIFLLATALLGAVPWLAKDFYLGNPDSHAYVMVPVSIFILFSICLVSEVVRTLAIRLNRFGWQPYIYIFLSLWIGASLFSSSSPLRADSSREAEALSSHLDTLPPRAFLGVGSDHWLFPLWYRTYTEGRRPDVAIVGKGLLKASWYMNQIEGRYAPLEGRPGFSGTREWSTVNPAGLLIGLESVSSPAAFDFVSACWKIGADPFSIRKSVCAQAVLTAVDQLQGNDAEKIRFTIRLLEAFVGVSPTNFSCSFVQPLVLPFPLYETHRFLAHPAQPRTMLARFYVGCRQPQLARAVLNQGELEVNGQLIAAALAYQAGEKDKIQSILQPKSDQTLDEISYLNKAKEILSSGS